MLCTYQWLAQDGGCGQLQGNLTFSGFRIGQSHDFWRAYSLFVARVASFAPERSEGANDATRDTKKLYARQKSCDYHYYQYTRSNINRTNSFNKKKMFNRDVA